MVILSLVRGQRSLWSLGNKISCVYSVIKFKGEKKERLKREGLFIEAVT